MNRKIPEKEITCAEKPGEELGIEEAGAIPGEWGSNLWPGGPGSCGRGFPYHCAGRHGWTAAGPSRGSSSGPRQTGICTLLCRSGRPLPRCWSRSSKPSGTQGQNSDSQKLDTCPQGAKPLSSCPPSHPSSRVSTLQVLSHLASQITLSDRNHFLDSEAEAQRGE